MIKIGKIVNTHALKGELKIKSYTDFFEERFKVGQKLFIEFDNQTIEVTVKKSRLHKDLVYCVFESYEHINLVEQFKGCLLYIDEEDIHTLEEDAYYFHELLGCKVYEDVYIGDVVEVLDYPAQQILVIGEKRLMVPFVHAFVKNVDIQAKRIDVCLIEGMR